VSGGQPARRHPRETFGLSGSRSVRTGPLLCAATAAPTRASTTAVRVAFIPSSCHASEARCRMPAATTRPSGSPPDQHAPRIAGRT
jgi:hypothetical protein